MPPSKLAPAVGPFGPWEEVRLEVGTCHFTPARHLVFVKTLLGSYGYSSVLQLRGWSWLRWGVWLLMPQGWTMHSCCSEPPLALCGINPFWASSPGCTES